MKSRDTSGPPWSHDTLVVPGGGEDDLANGGYDIDGRMRTQVAAWVAAHPQAERLLADPVIGGDGLDGARGLTWDEHARYLNALVDHLGEEAVVDGIAEDLFAGTTFRLMVHALATIATPAAAYRLFVGMGDRMNPGMRHQQRRPAPGRLVIELGRPPSGRLVCPVFFRITARTLAILPARLLGAPEARVQCETDGASATFDILMPPGRTWLARLRNAWRALFGDDPMAELVFQEQADARERMHELQRLMSDLDARVTARTAELEVVNASLARASANKSRHLAELSHELRTPLNAIIGYAEMLAEEREDPDERRDLARIDTAAHHLLQLIGNVLDLAKIEAGRLEIQPVVAELAGLVQPHAEGLRTVVGRRGSRLQVQVEPVHARVDPMRLQQVLSNLIGNAAKFTREGVVSVRLQRVDDEAVLTVADTGCGMDEATLARVFEPYVQGATASTGPFRGTGLGLPIARELVEAMDGTLVAESRMGEGSTFTVRLPRVDPEDGATASA
jgi:signal transduction histidine kinase